MLASTRVLTGCGTFSNRSRSAPNLAAMSWATASATADSFDPSRPATIELGNCFSGVRATSTEQGAL
jgi:hypothetical protein